MKKPNILYLMTDEHRFDVLGFMGNNIVRTPNLDKLAKDAVVFNNAYAHNPICVPGRQCVLSGQMSSTNGCKRWAEDLPPGYQTFPRILSQYGYSTVIAGKLHAMGQDQNLGFTMRIGYDSGIAPHYIKDVKENFISSTNLKWSQAKEIERAGVGNSLRNRRDKYALDGLLLHIENTFLDQYYDRATPDAPIMLKLSLVQPHYPYVTTEEKFNYYLNRVKLYENTHMEDDEFLSLHPVGGTERDKQRMVAAYYGMVETVDEYFGQVVQALENVGQDLDDWIIVFTTDHGEMLGEHGVMEKQKFYEGSCRIPLFIRYPKMFSPKQVEENVSDIDIFATLLSICGIEWEQPVDSRSLINLMSGDNTSWNNEIISQYGGSNIMIKRDTLKYHFYNKTQKEYLFDLERDPLENDNFAEDERYTEFVKYCRKKIQGIPYSS